MDIPELMELVAQHPTEVSRRSGVSRATMKRIRDGVSQPTVHTLRELALSVGLDIDLRVVSASDPDAAVAARVMLESAMRDVQVRPEVTEWIRRFERYGLTDPRALVQEAGRLSSPVRSGSSIFFAPKPGISADRMARVAASAAATVNSRYVISGATAAAALVDTEVRGPLILWAEGADRVAEALQQTLPQASKYQPAGVVVAHAAPEQFVDAAVVNNMSFAAPMQVVIDLFGIGFESIADVITREW